MMISPFPGMDPWLEQHWGDVHQAMVTYARDQLQDRLPSALFARMQERVFVEYSDAEPRIVYPDVRVVEHRKEIGQPGVETTSALAVAEPLLVHLQNEQVTESLIEIIDANANSRVITVIEVLSPANKLPGKGQELYLAKQRELAEAGISLVEIDLLRVGARVTNAPPQILPRSHRTTYQACVVRGGMPAIAEVYRVPLRERLPVIRIPLRPHDADIALDLQVLIDEAYRKGRYAVSIDYRSDPYPPLLPEDAAWADDLLRSKGLR